MLHHGWLLLPIMVIVTIRVKIILRRLTLVMYGRPPSGKELLWRCRRTIWSGHVSGLLMRSGV